MDRVIITGANGSGKTHLGRRMSDARPDVPLVHYDAMKLTRNWERRPKDVVSHDLASALKTPCWIVEGGPSCLPVALPYADAVVWLDPPLSLRALRLFVRPVTFRNRTRPELPDDNPDHLISQWRFGWRSLRADALFRRTIHDTVAAATIPVIRCHTRVDVDSALSLWRTPPHP